jgi:hypothetical protein
MLLDRLRALAALPASRKVVVALVTGAVLWLDTRLGWGLSPDVLLGIAALGVSVIAGIAYEDAAKATAEAARKADPTPPVVFTRSEGGRASTYGLVAFLVAVVLAALLAGCNALPARHAADEAKRAAQYVAWIESGSVPRSGGVSEPATMTHALMMLRSQARAWESQAYYLGSGPKPAE